MMYIKCSETFANKGEGKVSMIFLIDFWAGAAAAPLIFLGKVGLLRMALGSYKKEGREAGRQAVMVDLQSPLRRVRDVD